MVHRHRSTRILIVVAVFALICYWYFGGFK